MVYSFMDDVLKAKRCPCSDGQFGIGNKPGGGHLKAASSVLAGIPAGKQNAVQSTSIYFRMLNSFDILPPQPGRFHSASSLHILSHEFARSMCPAWPTRRDPRDDTSTSSHPKISSSALQDRLPEKRRALSSSLAHMSSTSE